MHFMQEPGAVAGARPRRSGIAEDDDTVTAPNCPPVACKSWCIEGDGHPNQKQSADQFCIGDAREVVLRTWPKVAVSDRGDVMPSQIAVVLMADVDEPMHVEIVLDDIAGHTGSFNMTGQEAHDLAIDLLLLVAQSEGQL